jgi:hypothetical protein
MISAMQFSRKLGGSPPLLDEIVALCCGTMMSPIGTERTSLVASHMSALGGKADIGCAQRQWF